MSHLALAVYVRDTDEWLYMIDDHHGAELRTEGGEALRELPSRNWWAGPPALERVVMQRPPIRRAVRYVLADGVSIPGAPQTVDAADWEYDDQPYYEAYRRVVEGVEVPAETIDLRRVDIPTRLVQVDDPLTWHASIPYAVKEVPQLHSAFPGRLGGVRKWIKPQIESRSVSVSAYSGYEALVSIELDPSEQRPARGRGRNRIAAKTHRTVRVDLSWIPAHIEAETVAAAMDRAEELLEQARAAVSFTGCVCPHCDGTGIVPKEDA